MQTISRATAGTLNGDKGKSLPLKSVLCADELQPFGDSEQHFRRIIDALPTAIYITDATGRITHFNPACIEFSGRTPHLGSDSWCVTWKLFYPDGRPMPHDACPMAIALKEGRIIRGAEAIAERPDGTRIWFEPYPTPFFDDEGNIIGGINMLVDITERKQAEQTLRETQAQLEAELADAKHLHSIISEMFHQDKAELLYEEVMDAAVAIMHSDMASMQIVDEDEDALRMLAFRGFEPSFGEVFALIGPDTRTSCSVARGTGQRVIMHDVETSDMLVSELQQTTLQRHRKFGIRAVQSTPLLSRAGRLLGMISTHWKQPHEPSNRDLRLLDVLARQAADLIERTKAEQALRQSEERYRQTLALMPTAVYTCDSSGLITFYNDQAARLWGRTPVPGDTDERFCGSDQMILPDGRPMPHDQCPMAVALREGISFRDQEVNIRRPDGSLVTVRVSIDPVRDDQGRVVGAINAFHDVTALKQAEQALRDDDRRKNEFLAMLAHELRNPLAPIRNAVQVLRLKGGDETVQSVCETMERQVNQMVRMVDDLLDVNRVIRGTIELRTSRVELASIVHLAVESVRPLCESKGHHLSVTIPQYALYLDADAARLAQVLGNLLTNACKFTDNGGRISLTAEQERENVVVRVRDNGVGIAADELPNIFNMFTQIDTSLERSASGLGIGLTLVKKLIEMHGGTVEAHSDGIGYGSEFVVRLPISIATPGPRPSARTDKSPATTISRRILVVDDNRDSATTMAMLLKFTGHKTDVAHDGLEAVAAAEKFRPDVVLLDIGLPKLNGYEAAARIRAQSWGKSMLLVALTGWGQDDDRQKSKDAGFDAHMVKPVEHAALTKLLEESLARSHHG